MLSRANKLSRSTITSLSKEKLSSVYNSLGTLKFIKATSNKFSIIISSKNIKKAVTRNTLRRRLYVVAKEVFKKEQPMYSILYLAKTIETVKKEEQKELLIKLFKKAYANFK